MKQEKQLSREDQLSTYLVAVSHCIKQLTLTLKELDPTSGDALATREDLKKDVSIRDDIIEVIQNDVHDLQAD